MIRIGILFGGPAREREISFAGGKTAFENLDKSLFQPIPIFVDSFGRFIELKHECMYAANIREFYQYPSDTSEQDPYQLYIESYPELRFEEVPESIGKIITPDKLATLIDFAFLAMHGPDCEDGAIQGLLEWYKIPYSGPGILGSSIGIDKIQQNRMLELVNNQEKAYSTLRFDKWTTSIDKVAIFEEVKRELGVPIVVKAPHQGSSIGVAIVKEDSFEAFEAAVNQCFFIQSHTKSEWLSFNEEDKKAWAQRLANFDEGIGYPVYLNGNIYHHPTTLLAAVDAYLENNAVDSFMLISNNAEDELLFEGFIEGQEFSCGCIQHGDDPAFALPPTEVIKVVEVFDFASKYKPGGTRKKIPVDTTYQNNITIQERIKNAAVGLGMGVCVRIDGFLTKENEVLLHDPNTIPGMSPTSFIFKQMAEIGLNVTQSFTYFIRQSLHERAKTSKHTLQLKSLKAQLDQAIAAQLAITKKSVALVIEPTDEAYSNARKWYSTQFASGKTSPEVYLKQANDEYLLLPVQLLFKEYIQDVLELIQQGLNPVIETTRKNAAALTLAYAGNVNFNPILLKGTSSFDSYIETN